MDWHLGAQDADPGGGDQPPAPDIPRDKRDAFVRLAEKRTIAVLEKIRILGNLSNRSVYAFTEDDVEEIFGAIAAELELVKGRFASAQRRKPEFRLSRRIVDS